MNDDLEELLLLGDMGDNLSDTCKDHGANLRLQLDSSLALVLGLKDLGAIHCSNILEIDFAQILNNYQILGIKIVGNTNIFLISINYRSSRVSQFSTVDLFGFTAEDIPKQKIYLD